MTVKTCYCGKFEFGTWTAEVPEGADPGDYFETTSTECGRTTTRIFAQGHDAKLVGFLVRAELAGDEISITEGGVKVTFGGAVQAAAHVSEALAAKAQGQLDAARDRIRKSAVKALTKKITKKEIAQAIAEVAQAIELDTREVKDLDELEIDEADAAAALADREARIKVGRWTYDATISASGTATYSKKLGGTVTLAQGEYTEV